MTYHAGATTTSLGSAGGLTPAPSTPGEGTRLVADLLTLFRAGGAEAAFQRLRFPVLVERASGLDATLASLAHFLPSLQGTTAPAWAKVPGEVSRLSLGRASSNAIVVRSTNVSKRHASLIRREGDRWSVIDENSLNGTFLGWEKLKPGREALIPAELAVLRLGFHSELMLMHETAFQDFLRTLPLLEQTRRSNPSISKCESGTGTVDDALRGTKRGGACLDLLTSTILREVRSAAFPAHCYRVVLEEAVVDDFQTWPELVAFIERNAARVVVVEAFRSKNQAIVVHSRESSIGASQSRSD